MRIATIVIAASSLLLAQNNVLPVKSRPDSNVPDVRRIMESSIAATQRHWLARLNYNYTERSESRRRDPAGRLNSLDVDISKTFLVNGVPFEELLERNGNPPSAEEQRKQRDRMNRLKRETSSQRATRMRKQQEESASLVREVPLAFDFRLVGEEAVSGRPAWILQATPRADYHAQGKYGNMLSKVAGRLWIDKQDLGWVKVDGLVVKDFAMGLFLARVMRGSHITMMQTRLDGGIWMPQSVEVRASAKILFVRNLVVEKVLTYSDYGLQSDAGLTLGDAIVP